MRFNLRMASRFLRGSYPRLALTVFALALGVALVCAMSLVNRAVLGAFVNVVGAMAGRAALEVSAGDGAFISEDIASTVGGVGGVELAVPVVAATTFTADDAGDVLAVYGVDITSDAAVRVYESRPLAEGSIGDPLIFLSQPDSLLLTREFSLRRGVTIGDSIDLVTPAGNRRFVVRGLLDASGVARVYGGNLVVMDLYAAEKWFTRPGYVNRVDIVVSHDREVDEVMAEIRRAIPMGLHVEAPAQRKADISRLIRAFQTMLSGLGLIGLIAAFLITFNRIASVFEDRAWQLGVLRAVGVRSSRLWRELLAESVLLGALGVAIGIPLGIALGQILLPVIATTTALNYKLMNAEPTLAIEPWVLAIAAVLGVGTAILAAAVPAWRAASVALAATIRGRGREQPGVVRAVPWVTRALVGGGVLGSVGLQLALHSAVWGLVATALLAVAVALAARPLLDLSHAPLLRAIRSVSSVTGSFAVATVMENGRRSALTIGMLGVGLGAILWLWTVARSFEDSVVQTLAAAFRGDLAVSSSYKSSGFDDEPMDGGVVSRLRAVRGVAAVVGERIIDWHYAGGPIAIDAFDPAYFSGGEFGQWPLVGPRAFDVWSAVARGDAVIVSTNFVLNLGKHVGDILELDTPNGPLRVTIAGITNAFASPRGTIEMSRDRFLQFWVDERVTRAHVKATRQSDVGALRTEIARVFRDYRLRVLSSGDLLAYWADQVRDAFAGVNVLGFTILTVLLLGLADTLAAGVMARTRELGMMRALGVKRRQIRLVVLCEGLILCSLGLFLAIIGGLTLGVLWVEWTFSYLMGWILELHLPVRQVILGAAVTALVSILAAVGPARRAGLMEPAAALRFE